MYVTISPEAADFIESQEIAVLSSLSRESEIQGATIYYRFDRGKFYILTKSDSSKVHNMLAHPQIAMTIFDPDQIKTVQLQGAARIEADLATKCWVFDEIVQPRVYEGDYFMPPVTQLDAGSFIAFRITPTTLFYTDYKDRSRIIPSSCHAALV